MVGNENAEQESLTRTLSDVLIVLFKGNKFKVPNAKSKALIRANIHSHLPQLKNQVLHEAEMMHLLLKQQ